MSRYARRPRGIGASTRLVALLGDPVSHSRSPEIQNAAFEAAGVDGVYVTLRVPAGRVAEAMRILTAAGGAGNVTVPHKAEAAAALDVHTDAVLRTGACNTFWDEGGRLHGDNTDVVGFVRATREIAPDGVGATAAVIGAGGAARAAVAGLVDLGAPTVLVANRTRARAHDLVDELATETANIQVVDLHDVVNTELGLIVNATSLGLGSNDPSPTGAIPSAAAAMDLVYRPGGTAWVRSLREAGIPAIDGSAMLVEQAAAAFERWWGRPAPIDVMRATLGRIL